MSATKHARWRIAQFLGIMVPLLIASSVPSESATAQRPLDPLTAREAELAQRLARADARVRELIGQRKTVVGATDFAALKPESLETVPPRGESRRARFFAYPSPSYH